MCNLIGAILTVTLSKCLTSGSLQFISCFLICSITLHKQAAVPLMITRWQCLCVRVGAFVPDVLGNRYIACLQCAIRIETEINRLNLLVLMGHLSSLFLYYFFVHRSIPQMMNFSRSVFSENRMQDRFCINVFSDCVYDLWINFWG